MTKAEVREEIKKEFKGIKQFIIIYNIVVFLVILALYIKSFLK